MAIQVQLVMPEAEFIYVTKLKKKKTFYRAWLHDMIFVKYNLTKRLWLYKKSKIEITVTSLQTVLHKGDIIYPQNYLSVFLNLLMF